MNEVTLTILGAAAALLNALILLMLTLIFNAIKLWCRSLYTEDVEKAEMWRQRYVSLRDALKMAEGYGWKEEVPDE